MKKKLHFIIAAILVTIFIFSNSLQDAASSTQQSDVFVDAVVSTIQTADISADRSDVEYLVRKFAHFLEFAVQGLFITLCFDVPFKKRLYRVLLAGFLTGCTDEFIQLFSNGRAAMLQDIFIDTTGCLAGFLAIWFIYAKRRCA